MIRRINKLLSVVSLLLCMLMLAEWARSFWVCDTLSRSHVLSTANPADSIAHSLFWDDGLIGYALTRETYTDKVIAASPIAWQLKQTPANVDHGVSQSLLQRIGFHGKERECSVIDTHQMRDTGHGVFRTVHVVNSYTRDSWTIPGVLPAAVFGIYPAIRGYRRFRRRGKSGLCRNCNYDLTGNTSGTCPECGTTLHLPEARPWR